MTARWLLSLLLVAACRTEPVPAQAESVPVDASTLTHAELARIARKFDPAGGAALPLAPGLPPEPVAPIPADALVGPPGVRYRYLSRGAAHEKHRWWDRVTLRYTVWAAQGMAASSRVFGSEDAVSYDAERIPPEWAAQVGMLEQGDKVRFWFGTRAGDQDVPLMADFELLAVQQLPAPPSPPRDQRGARAAGHGVRYRVLKRGAGRSEGNLEMHCTAWAGSGELVYTSVGKAPVTLPASELPNGVGAVMSAAREGSETLFWLPAQLGDGLRLGLMPAWPFTGLVVLRITVNRRFAADWVRAGE